MHTPLPSNIPSEDSLTVDKLQDCTEQWLTHCFGAEVLDDVQERNDRFLEEALELYQANGGSVRDASRLIKYVFSRPRGEPFQEVGGVMLTLMGLCSALKMHLSRAARTELVRQLEPERVARVRAKRASRQPGSPLPGADT